VRKSVDAPTATAIRKASGGKPAERATSIAIGASTMAVGPRTETGFDVDPACAMIDHRGQASTRLFAAGRVTRAQFWEITAVPDIRMQAAVLANRLLDDMAGAQGSPTRDSAVSR
jgi:uncharacterized NAD(P)/FAD-binding protein YdhS